LPCAQEDQNAVNVISGRDDLEVDLRVSNDENAINNITNIRIGEPIDRIASHKKPASYLDIYMPSIDGGNSEGDNSDRYEREELNEDEADVENRYFMSMANCNYYYKCKRLLCSNCGGKGNIINKKRYAHVMTKISQFDYDFVRQFVFTVPKTMRGIFWSREGLNIFFKAVNSVMKKEFGEVSRTREAKKGTEKYYNLSRPVIAILHIFAKDDSFNPHVNVLMFENGSETNKPRLPQEQLARIKETYKRALIRSTGMKIEEVAFHYRYKVSVKDIKNCIGYMTAPFAPDLCKSYDLLETFRVIDFIVQDLKGFSYIRYWGALSNNKFKMFCAHNENQ